jgi:hypothetical protein
MLSPDATLRLKWPLTPVGIALEVVLVLGLSLPEATRRSQFGYNPGWPEPRGIDVSDCVVCDLRLLIACVKDR